MRRFSCLIFLKWELILYYLSSITYPVYNQETL